MLWFLCCLIGRICLVSYACCGLHMAVHISESDVVTSCQLYGIHLAIIPNTSTIRWHFGFHMLEGIQSGTYSAILETTWPAWHLEG